MAKDKKPGFWSAVLEGVKKGVVDAIHEIAEKADIEAIERKMREEDEAMLKGGSTPSSLEAESEKSKNKEKTAKSDGRSSPITLEIKIDQVIDSLTKIAKTTGKTILEYAENGKADLQNQIRMLKNSGERSADFEVKDGCAVKYIATDQAFAFVPAGVRVIGKEAFANHASLVSVWMPDSVEKIEQRAFYGCKSLRTVIFSKSLRTLGASCFENCVMLREVDLPLSVRAIRKSAFEGCSGLVRAELPQGAKSIGSRAFMGCKSLESVGWPWEPDTVGNMIFMDCFTPDSRFDRFEKEGTRYVRHRYDQDWLEECGVAGLLSDSPLAQWFIDRVIQDIHGYFIPSEAHAWRIGKCWDYFCGIMELVDIMTQGDPFAVVVACRHMRTVVADIFEKTDIDEDVLSSSNDYFMLLTVLIILSLIGGNGNHYRYWDQEFQKEVNSLCDGHLREILDAFSVDPRELVEDETPSPKEDKDEGTHLLIHVPVSWNSEGQTQSEEEKNEDTEEHESLAESGDEAEQATKKCRKRKRRHFQFRPMGPDTPTLSEKQEDDLILWLRFLGALGVMPVTQRYNPRIFHYVAVFTEDMNYWMFVDIIEGLIRGYGIESRRFNADVSEDDTLEAWCAAWSRAIAEEKLVILEMSVVTSEKYEVFAIFEDDGTAESVKYLLDAYHLDFDFHLWRNGIDLYKFRVV